MFAAGAASATVALLLFIRWQHPSSNAVATASDGKEQIVREHERLPMDRGYSRINLREVGRMVAGPETVATFQRFDKQGVTLAIDRGSVLLHVNPRSPNAPFVVRTPGFSAKVVGTVLRVAVHADGRSSLTVGHGAVEVRANDGSLTVVRSQQRWPADATDLPGLGELEQLGTADLEGTTFDSFAPVLPASSDAECQGTGILAVHCYESLAATADPMRAESALYQAGWIAFHNLRDPKQALAIWALEDERFPNGVLTREVRASTVDALVAARSPRARAAVETYLRDYPKSLRAAEMHFVLGTLLREEDRDCHRASAEFALALRHPAEPWATRAAKARAACAAGRSDR
jgi:hypothetical protein